jgi:hypothetical protein
MSISISHKKLLARITGIPIDQIEHWYKVSSLAIYHSPVHNADDPRVLISLMKKLYSSAQNRRVA